MALPVFERSFRPASAYRLTISDRSSWITLPNLVHSCAIFAARTQKTCTNKKSRGFLLCFFPACTLPQVLCQIQTYCSGARLCRRWRWQRGCSAPRHPRTNRSSARPSGSQSAALRSLIGGSRSAGYARQREAYNRSWCPTKAAYRSSKRSVEVGTVVPAQLPERLASVLAKPTVG